MKIKYLYLGIVCLLCFQNSDGQKLTTQIIRELGATLYTLQTPGDTINFIKADTNTTYRKPTLLFCQGSLPIPLLIHYEEYGPQFSFFNFDYRKLSQKYNLIVISMPHTPSIVSYSRLNPNGTYSPDPAHADVFDTAYLKDNHLERYVERANRVIHYVLSQPWAEPEAFYVVGHSQGAAIAACLAQTNRKIKALGYFSGDPDGRFSQKIKEIRQFVQQKKITPREAQEKRKELQNWWKEICNNQQPSGNTGDAPHTWQSFSGSLRETLTNLQVPVFIAYGTEDICSSGCELLPVYFELNHKTDYQMYPVVGCGHNFEEFTTEGKPDYEKMHWQEIMDQFISYIEN